MTAGDPRQHPYYTADGEWTFDVHYVGGQPGYMFSAESVRRVLSQVEAFVMAQQQKTLERDGVTPTSCVMTVRLQMTGTPRE